MHLTLTQTTINQQTYWLGTTPTGLAFVGRANGPRDEWQAFFKSANIHYDQQAKLVNASILTYPSTKRRAPLYNTKFGKL